MYLISFMSHVAGPHIWNMLSASLHFMDDFVCFKLLLKAHLFD